MYSTELHRENQLIVNGWQAIINDFTQAFQRVGAMLTLSRSETLSTFELHRVPGSDKLR